MSQSDYCARGRTRQDGQASWGGAEAMRRPRLILTLLAAAAAVSAAAASVHPANGVPAATVASITDGDTLRLTNGARVRGRLPQNGLWKDGRGEKREKENQIPNEGLL